MRTKVWHILVVLFFQSALNRHMENLGLVPVTATSEVLFVGIPWIYSAVGMLSYRMFSHLFLVRWREPAHAPCFDPPWGRSGPPILGMATLWPLMLLLMPYVVPVMEKKRRHWLALEVMES